MKDNIPITRAHPGAEALGKVHVDVFVCDWPQASQNAGGAGQEVGNRHA